MSSTDEAPKPLDRGRHAPAPRAPRGDTDELRWPSTADLRRGACIGCEREGVTGRASRCES